MKKILKYTLAAALICTAGTAHAQELRASYFSKTSNFRHQINPALLDKAYVAQPFTGNINLGATGNVGLKNFVYKLNGNPDYDLTTFMSPTVDTKKFLGDLDSKNRLGVHKSEAKRS